VLPLLPNHNILGPGIEGIGAAAAAKKQTIGSPKKPRIRVGRHDRLREGPVMDTGGDF
jgi:hypothetical protein